jgi:hypothetical protein
MIQILRCKNKKDTNDLESPILGGLALKLLLMAYTVQDVPNHYSLIYGSTLAELQQDAKSYHKLKNALLGQAKCNWNPFARRHLAAGMMQIPYASFTGVEQLIPCVVAAIFAAADNKVDTKSLLKNCPSESLLK